MFLEVNFGKYSVLICECAYVIMVNTCCWWSVSIVKLEWNDSVYDEDLIIGMTASHKYYY